MIRRAPLALALLVAGCSAAGPPDASALDAGDAAPDDAGADGALPDSTCEACGHRGTLSVGGESSCALTTATGGVVCWGQGLEGQLGGGYVPSTVVLSPVPVSGLSDAVEVAAGDLFACARRASGAVVCWGSNPYGELGDGATHSTCDEGDCALSPVSVAGLSDAVAIATGTASTCAIRRGGTVACWGYNMSDELGIVSTTTCGTVPCVPTPLAVPGLSDVREIAAGADFNCALQTSGVVVCWGDGSYGELGNGVIGSVQTVPTPVHGLTDAVEVELGDEHGCARRASGSVVCWGLGMFGQLGDGTHTTSAEPVEVVGVTDAVELAAGQSHTCARRAGGTVVCWGSDGFGQLGIGSVTTPQLATPVVGVTDAVEIAAGGFNTCVRRAGGQVLCWGINSQGEAGDGTTMLRDAPSPVAVP